MKRITKLSVLITFVLFAANQLLAESVFMKSGAVLEGKIIRENDAAVTLKNADGIISRIPRKNIQRVLYHDDYKQAKYIGTKDKKIIRGYIVAENNDGYTVRKDLKKKEELVVDKKNVLYVSSKRLVLAEEKNGISTEKNEKSRKPYLSPWYNDIRLGMRLQYFLGQNYTNTSAKHLGHTGGLNFYCHWQSFEFEFLVGPQYNKEGYFLLNATSAWLPFTFNRLKVGFILGYGLYEDNLGYFGYQNGDGSLAKYHALNYGLAFNYADWLRFSFSFGMLVQAEIKYSGGGTTNVYEGYNLIPVSSSKVQVEYIFFKHYSVYLGCWLLLGNQEQVSGLTPVDFRHHLMFFSLGLSYRFHL